MIDAVKQQIGLTGTVIAATKAAQFGTKTPCETFDTKGLINHVIGGNYLFAEVAAGKTIDANAEMPDFVGKDHAKAFEDSKKAVFAALEAPGVLDQTWHFPFGDMPGPQAIGVVLLETVVHRWDLARATGQDPNIDPGLATMILEGAKQGIKDEFRGEGPEFPFKKAVTVPDSATPVEKLVAFLGRTP